MKIKSAALIAIMLSAFLCISGGLAFADTLNSQFFGSDTNAIQVISGTPYDMDDPAWISNWDINKDSFAYKVMSGLFMLGYQTEMGYNYGSGQQLRVIKAFQANNGLAISNSLDSTCLAAMDAQLAVREAMLAPLAPDFPLYDHMQPLHPNDISRDTLAVIYSLPISVMPESLHMSAYETVQCIAGQCDGFIQNSAAVELSSWPVPIDMASDYRFVGAYFDPLVNNSRMPSAAVHVGTVVHEYGHYLDGFMKWAKDGLQPHIGLINTTGFYSIGYDLSNSTTGGCYARRSASPMDWITKYAYNPGYDGCTGNMGPQLEDWADSFHVYITAGRDFRAAALESPMIAQRYDWLKVNVFDGTEYDTDLPGDISSGCNDVHGTEAALPGYMHCDDSYIWDFTLPMLAGGAEEDTPDGFAFAATTNAATSALVASDPITVNGISVAAPITVIGGEYSVNAGGFTDVTGWVQDGDSVRVRLHTPASYSSVAAATLMIGGVSGTFSATTLALAPPAIGGTPATAVTTGDGYSFTPTATDAASFGILNEPAWADFDTANGALSGTPESAGSYSGIIITAFNSAGSASLPEFSITVLIAPPMISGTPASSATVGDSYSFTPSSSNATSFSILNKPAWADFNTTDGTLSGIATPAGLYNGIILRAINGSGSALLPVFSITVTPPAPTISGTPPTGAAIGVPYAFTPVATNAASFSITGSVPPGLIFNTTTGTLDGTPITAGTYSGITITASNGSATAALPAFTITVSTPIGGFVPAAPMLSARQLHTATLLPDGRVLVTGGYADNGLLSSAELYDPAADTWSPAAPMLAERADHSATLLKNGKVLIASGSDMSGEVYDPATGSWSATGPMSDMHGGPAAALLANGKVLVAGGMNWDGSTNTAELFNPADNTWSTIDPMLDYRYKPAVATLPDGRVLIAGGYGWEGPLASAEIFDPADNSWSAAGTMTDARYVATAALLPDGKVLVAGGFNQSDALATAEIYDPAENSWSQAETMYTGRYGQGATLVQGKVLVSGGGNGYDSYRSAELYDPSSKGWQFAGPMQDARSFQTSTLLNDGRVLVAGGTAAIDSLSSAELYEHHDLTVDITGSGSVSPDKGAIEWSGSTGTAFYASGSTVTLTATPGAGFVFTGWTGCSSPVGSTCPILISGAKTVSAAFATNAPPVTTASTAGYTFGTWSISNSINVTLSAADGAGPGIAAGYPKYCMDLTNTCSPSTSYTAAIKVNCAAGTTCTQYVRYQSKDTIGNTEAIKNAIVKQDLQAPVSAPSATGYTFGAWSMSNSISVALSATDGAGGSGLAAGYPKYCVDAANTCATAISYTTAIKVNCAAGTNCTQYVRYQSKDKAGNAEGLKGVVVKQDVQAPVSIAAASGYTFGAWSISNSINVTLSAADGAGSGLAAGYPKYCVDAANTCTPATSYTAAVKVNCAAGTTCTQYFRYQSKDKAGNSEAVKSAAVRQDVGAKPVTAASAAGYTFGTWSMSNSISVTLSAADGSGIATGYPKYCVDKTNTCAPATSYVAGAIKATCAAYSACMQYVRYQSRDNAGNVEAVRSSVVKQDLQAPGTTPTAAGYTFGTWSISSSISVTLISSDGAGSGIAAGFPKYCVDKANTCTPGASYSTAFKVNCAAGTACTQYIRYQTKDKLGNTTTVKSATVKQDVGAKPVTTASAAGYTFGALSSSNSISVTLTATDGSGSGIATGFPKYCVDKANACTPATSYSTAFKVNCASGSTCTQYVRYQSKDKAGNTEGVKTSTVKQKTASASGMSNNTQP